MLNFKKIEAIVNGLASLKENAENALEEARAAHARIKHLVSRVAAIEHYVGLRNNHHLPESPQPYHFRQIKYDINTKEIPKSLIYSKPPKG